MQPSAEIMENIENLVKIVVSDPIDKTAEYPKMIIKPISSKNGIIYQFERFKGTQVFHLNLRKSDFEKQLEKLFSEYRQVCVFYAGRTVTYSVGTSKTRKSAQANALSLSVGGNDREKQYILGEGEEIPVLVDLGVFSQDYRIIKSKYDKFKQINRFIEIIDDELKNFHGEEITVLDFGYGKSYLTFIVRHYLVNIRRIKAKIIGYDLKADVVADCNEIAKKYGYDDIEFVVADVKIDVLYDKKIDMIISLHACDTATDYALDYAIKKDVKYIFSVPCCQHEINLSVSRGGELDFLLKYGIIKERVSALMTDSIRALILEDFGYSVDVLEFVDLSHSPKNLMLRAVKTKRPTLKNRAEIEKLISSYGFRQTLFELTK